MTDKIVHSDTCSWGDELSHAGAFACTCGALLRHKDDRIRQLEGALKDLLLVIDGYPQAALVDIQKIREVLRSS